MSQINPQDVAAPAQNPQIAHLIASQFAGADVVDVASVE
jgi:hypothetical protein